MANHTTTTSRKLPYNAYWREEVGEWYVNFHISIDGNRKRVRKPTGVKDPASTEAAWRAAERVWTASGAAAEAVAQGQDVAMPSLDDLLAKFLGEWLPTFAAGRNRKKRRLNERYLQTSEAYLKMVLPYMPQDVRQIDNEWWEDAMHVLHDGSIPEHRKEWFQILRPQDGKPWSKKPRLYKWATIGCCLLALRQFLNFCGPGAPGLPRTLGLLRDIPKLSPPSEEAIENDQAARRAMTEQERDNFLKQLKDEGNLFALRCYLLMFFAGFRRSTVARLTPRWIDFKSKTITPPGLQIKNRQTGHGFAMHPLVEKAIVEQMTTNREERDGGVVELDKPIFGEINFHALWKRICREVNIDTHGLTAHHGARHTAGTMVCRTAQSMEEALAFMGQKDLRSLRKYWHPSVRLSAQANTRIPLPTTL
jgi:integrase